MTKRSNQLLQKMKGQGDIKMTTDEILALTREMSRKPSATVLFIGKTHKRKT